MLANQVLPTAVDRFLKVLEESDRELLLDVVEHSSSPLEIWTLAIVLGYTGSFGNLVKWAHTISPPTDRRQLLSRQAEQLEQDIANARTQIAAMLMDADKGFSRIAFLSKELRGHLIEVDRMSKAVDRRGLILAGADRVMRELRGIFAGDGEMEDALTQAFKAVWATLSEER